MHSVGIIGLPNVGKSTLFKALTKIEVNISNYPFTTIKPNVGIVQIPDQRLEKIAQAVKPQKTIPYILEFFDIAGLVKNAHKGEGLGNQFLSEIRQVDLLLEVVRAFGDRKIAHVEGAPDPQRDIEIIRTELLLKDLEIIERRFSNLAPKAHSGEKKAKETVEKLQKIKNLLEEEKINQLSEVDGEIAKELLSAKPLLYLINVNEVVDLKDIKLNLPSQDIFYLNIQQELEAMDLSQEERKELELEPSRLDALIKACYNKLDLVTFFTIKGGTEARSWAIKRGTSVQKAAGLVHTDFAEKFIRAEVISWSEFLKYGNWSIAKTKGVVRTEGRTYQVQDGDIIEFKIAP